MAAFIPSTFANGVASAATYPVDTVPVILSAAVVIWIAVALTLKAIGFTQYGPAAGSCAAAWMSSTAIANGGAVPAGSLYSVAQALAMGGGGGVLLRAPAVLAVGAVAFAFAGAVLWKAWF